MPENSPGHGKRMIVATNDPMAPYWIQQCCKQQGIFHGIQWISNTDELLAELKKFNADAAFVDMDFIGEKLMSSSMIWHCLKWMFPSSLSAAANQEYSMRSLTMPGAWHSTSSVQYLAPEWQERCRSTGISCCVSWGGPRRRVNPGRSCRSRGQG